jgi:protein-L-isoaspartate(D-aspartate) O-methyltransferase
MELEELARHLHGQMVDLLVQQKHIRSPSIERAFRSVPRHRLLPDKNPVEVYQDTAIPIKQAGAADRLPQGRPLSSSTMPSLLAGVLEAAALRPGMRVLQIGTGPGYLAALAAHLVGESGLVVTVEIDEEVSRSAGERLAAAGWPHVRCVAADGVFGHPAGAPYDRILVTASCAEVPPAWVEQLAEEGLLILPFSLTQRASMYPMVAFRRSEGGLAGRVASNLVGVGFIPLYGESVAYPVLYEERITGLERAFFTHLQQSRWRREEYAAITLVGILQIADAVEADFDSLAAVKPEELCAGAVRAWRELGKPRVEEFRFLLLRGEPASGRRRWCYRKPGHTLAVDIAPEAGASAA